MKQAIIGTGMMMVIIFTVFIYMILHTDTVEEVELDSSVDVIMTDSLEMFMKEDVGGDIEKYVINQLALSYNLEASQIAKVSSDNTDADLEALPEDIKLAVNFLAADDEMGILSIEVYTIYSNLSETKSKSTQYTAIYERPAN